MFHRILKNNNVRSQICNKTYIPVKEKEKQNMSDDNQKTDLIKEITTELSNKSCGELSILKFLAEVVLQIPKDSSVLKIHPPEDKHIWLKF